MATGRSAEGDMGCRAAIAEVLSVLVLALLFVVLLFLVGGQINFGFLLAIFAILLLVVGVVLGLLGHRPWAKCPKCDRRGQTFLREKQIGEPFKEEEGWFKPDLIRLEEWKVCDLCGHSYDRRVETVPDPSSEIWP